MTFTRATAKASVSQPTHRAALIAIALLREAQACAVAHGARALITVSPRGVERLLRSAGFRAHRMAPPQVVDGHPLFACLIYLDD